MGKPTDPVPVKFFVAVLGFEDSHASLARELLVSHLGRIDMESGHFRFDLTHYYEPEMGPGLLRWFWTFEGLIDPGALADIKCLTNEFEDKLSEEGKRKINLDPGYLDMHKIILASVKERAQKIYLSRGIYADPTLYYLKGGFHAYDWTLPDFKLELYWNFFAGVRKKYLEDLRNRTRTARSEMGLGE